MNKIIVSIAIVLGLAVAFWLGINIGKNAPPPIGSYTQDFIDSAQGFRVDGRTIIDGTGVLTDATFGGGIYSTTTGATGTTTAASLCDFNEINITVGPTAGTSFYFPSTTTLAADTDCLVNIGDSRTILIYSSSSTDSSPGATTTFSVYSGTGLEIMVATGTPNQWSNALELSNWQVMKTTIWKRSTATTSLLFQKLFLK